MIEAKHFKDFDIKARKIDDVGKIIDKLKADGFVFFHEQPYVEIYIKISMPFNFGI